MQTLNLPPYEIKTRQREDGRTEIYDTLRRRYVALTPEEWVRQHFTHYLTEHLHYPAGLLANEVSITVNGTTRRCDSVLYDKTEKRPRVIVEYKAPDVTITQDVFNQINSYNSVLRADNLIVSNGIRHFCLYMDYENMDAEYLPSIPNYYDLK